jgi:hypothetical protein
MRGRIISCRYPYLTLPALAAALTPFFSLTLTWDKEDLKDFFEKKREQQK